MKVKKGMLRIVLLLSMIGIVYSFSSIMVNVYAYKESGEKYAQLKQIYRQSEGQSESDKHKRLKKLSEDYIGWLSVDGTAIDYPVVQGDDNEFYLNHNFYKEDSMPGAIYMDNRNTAHSLDEHSIVYGHNMKDDSMFGTLANVLEQDFSEENRIRFETENKVYEWEIFSVYQTRVTDWMKVDFVNLEDYEQSVEQLALASQKKFHNEEIDTDEKMITLATCTGRFSDERTIVHARLVEGNK